MTRERITEMLSETICVTMEDAETALAANDWNVRDAARQLLMEKERAAKARAARARLRDGERSIGGIRALIAGFGRGRLAGVSH